MSGKLDAVIISVFIELLSEVLVALEQIMHNVFSTAAIFFSSFKFDLNMSNIKAVFTCSS